MSRSATSNAARCSGKPILLSPRRSAQRFAIASVPILCVGEASRLDPATTADVCVRQVLSALPHEIGDAATSRVIVAYEPCWAIGAAEPAPTRYVTDVCQRVRIALAEHVEDFAITYGGSPDLGC